MIVLFKSSVPLLIFCLPDLLITEKRVLKPPALIVNLIISPPGSIKFA